MRMTDVVALSRPRVLSSLAGTAEPRVYGSSKANKIKTWAKHILGRGKDIAIFSKKITFTASEKRQQLYAVLYQ